ncbi:hypothetical protein MHM84_01165 [Halomonas sp. McH1-25]|uniref:hypothetical protein n=1 Tax=unclassified Halomonas TaxID=2609666 RepID=UPI001EF4A382|nr:MULTISPECIES: hypothetical protein [unclassified Halomonas]MCG7598391.1 hypothetical protein [Halomonas sp. McH1-25]MCP1342667.1 hypothetical protein [Halomonas sp. FL8]MCP1362565.1 hypothetical protein [Halomonas sp. BBD45]MCP1363731.1 hypothetical protein [Halomonas sp. BBD48]
MTMAQRVLRSVRVRLGTHQTSFTNASNSDFEDEAPVSLRQAEQARREAEYQARREGAKAPLLQVWKV